MPHVTLRTIVNGREETLSEYMCDWANCPNAAVEVMGFVRELRLASMLCAEHAALVKKRRQKDGTA
jgi:hypothetical protein